MSDYLMQNALSVDIPKSMLLSAKISDANLALQVIMMVANNTN